MIQRTAIVVGSPACAKQAALYFDHVIHLWLGLDVAPRHPFWPDEIKFDHDASAELTLLEHNHALIDAKRVDERFDLLRPAGGPGLSMPPLLFPKSDGSTNARLEHNYLNNANGVLDDLERFLARHRVKDSIFVGSSSEAFANQGASPDPAVVISGLKLVNTQETNWNQIIQFREDGESVRRFRRLSTFMEDELSDKSRGYIEDRVNVELENYLDACTKHGFDLVTGTLTAVVDSKTLLAASSASIIAFLAGAPLLAIVGVPVLLELAHVTVSIANGIYALNEAKRLHPMSYIIQARNRLEQ